MMKKALVVEDNSATADWVRQVLASTFPSCHITVCHSLREAVPLVQKECFDLALIDLGLPDGSGLEILRWFTRQGSKTLSVVLTVMAEDEMLLAAFSAGASGYLLKEQSAEEMRESLLRLKNGDPALSASIARRLIDHFRQTGPARPEDSGLTPREVEILALIARGYRNKDVAENLAITEHTVASHIKSIYQKLAISSRAEASFYATKFGL
ncbi:MAG: response regulator transcription factor [Verrucomicrobiota bacterium JB023]|nr:response regulator transcription factor [Verrucomicrobiota bacterium JB023]